MKKMKNKDELQRDIEQFDFRLVRETKVSKNAAGGLTIRHLPPDSTRQWNEVRRFRDFVESNWTVREIDFAASFHPAGKNSIWFVCFHRPSRASANGPMDLSIKWIRGN